MQVIHDESSVERLFVPSFVPSIVDDGSELSGRDGQNPGNQGPLATDLTSWTASGVFLNRASQVRFLPGALTVLGGLRLLTRGNITIEGSLRFASRCLELAVVWPCCGPRLARRTHTGAMVDLRPASDDDSEVVAAVYIESWNQGFGHLLGIRQHNIERIDRWRADLAHNGSVIQQHASTEPGEPQSLHKNRGGSHRLPLRRGKHE